MTQDETEHGRTDERPDDRPMPGDATYPAVEGRTDDAPPPEDRPMPGDGTGDTDTDESEEPKSDEPKSEDAKSDEPAGDDDGDGDDPPAGPDAEPVYNDRDKLDFDPDEGLYTGTAVTGDTEIPGEHERVDDVPVEEDGDDTKESDGDSDDESA